MALTTSQPQSIKHISLNASGGLPIELKNDQRIFALREDVDFVVATLTQEFKGPLSFHPDKFAKLQRVIRDEYTRFCEKMGHLLSEFTKSPEDLKPREVHIFNSRELDSKVLAGVRNIDAALSLDPLVRLAPLAMSRQYALGGKVDLCLGARPGFLSPEEQLSDLKEKLSSRGLPLRVELIEDDIYSGGSVLRALKLLWSNGFSCDTVHVGIQIGDTSQLNEAGVKVLPVVRYASKSSDIQSLVELGDFRDFLIGASGLVVRTPQGQVGRAPYTLPFASPSARASVRKDLEMGFSLSVLQANREFYHNCENLLGFPLTVGAVDPAFRRFVSNTFSVQPSSPMTGLVNWASDNLSLIKTHINTMGRQQHDLAKLGLPQKMILLDINGTLIPEDAKGTNLDPIDLAKFKKLVHLLELKGVKIGLCSDSPLNPMISLRSQLDLNGPILAENGHLIWNLTDSAEEKWRSFRGINISEVKGEILRRIEEAFPNLRQAQDQLSQEFGGGLNTLNTWAFGEGRECSVSIFAEREVIEDLGQYFNDLKTSKPGWSEFSFDVSAEHRYFAVHPYNFRECKRETISLLGQHGLKVLMLGNSKSDFIPPGNDNISCAFVSDPNLPFKIASQASYASDQPCLKGVIDILEKVLGTLN